MSKRSKALNDKSKVFSKIPIRIILFWYKAIRNYIIKLKNENKDNEENIEFPTINFGRTKKMNILELYIKIRNHIKKHSPLIHNKIKASNKETINKGDKATEKTEPIKNESEDKNKNEKNFSNTFKVKKFIFGDIYRDEDLSDEIKTINEINCINIIHLFKSYKFDEETAKNFDNYFVKMIVCDREKSDLSYKREDCSTAKIISILDKL